MSNDAVTEPYLREGRFNVTRFLQNECSSALERGATAPTDSIAGAAGAANLAPFCLRDGRDRKPGQ